MTRLTPILTASALAVALTGGAAFAKAHDQGSTADPGANVKTETVGPAQTLGAGKGNRPTDLPPGQMKKTGR